MAAGQQPPSSRRRHQLSACPRGDRTGPSRRRQPRAIPICWAMSAASQGAYSSTSERTCSPPRAADLAVGHRWRCRDIRLSRAISRALDDRHAFDSLRMPLYHHPISIRSITCCLVPRRALLLGLAILFSFAVTPIASGGSGGRTLIYTYDGFLAKPSTLEYGGADFGLPGVSYTASALQWRGWGRTSSRAAGRLKVCPNMAPCRRFRVNVVASGLVVRGEGTPDNNYTYVSFTRQGRNRPYVKLCVYAEACELGPTGR